MPHAVLHNFASLLLVLVVFAPLLAHRRVAPDSQVGLRFPGCSLLSSQQSLYHLNMIITPLPTYDIQLRSPWNQWSCFRSEYLQGNRQFIEGNLHMGSPTHLRIGRPSEPKGENAFFTSLAAA